MRDTLYYRQIGLVFFLDHLSKKFLFIALCMPSNLDKERKIRGLMPKINIILWFDDCHSFEEQIE